MFDGRTLKVTTYLASFRFDLQDATEVQLVAPVEISPLNTVRLFGIGWPLRRVGWFRNQQFGTFLLFADNRRSLYLVKTPKRTMVVSPANGMDSLLS